MGYIPVLLADLVVLDSLWDPVRKRETKKVMRKANERQRQREITLFSFCSCVLFSQYSNIFGDFVP